MTNLSNEIYMDNKMQSETKYFVVVNHEEQYSIWPDYKEIPSGWKAAIKTPKPKEDCLRYIEEVWTDMRPLSLRKKMDQ
jgi:MbtH protein